MLCAFFDLLIKLWKFKGIQSSIHWSEPFRDKSKHQNFQNLNPIKLINQGYGNVAHVSIERPILFPEKRRDGQVWDHGFQKWWETDRNGFHEFPSLERGKERGLFVLGFRSWGLWESGVHRIQHGYKTKKKKEKTTKKVTKEDNIWFGGWGICIV